MRPLKTSQRVLTWLCLYPADSTISIAMKTIYIIFAVFTFSTSLIICISALMCFWKFVKIDSNLALYSTITAIACFTVVYAYIVMFFSRKKIQLTFEDLEKIYDARKSCLSCINRSTVDHSVLSE